MTEDTKQRINAINRGEVPHGYKKTKVGIVPTEWEECAVIKCIKEYRSFSNDIGNYPVYSSSRQGLIPQSEYYKKEATETNLGYKIVPNLYVTYRHMSDDDIFFFNINNTGKDILVSSEYPVFTSSIIVDLNFLIPSLNSTARFRYFCRGQKLGGTRTRLYLKNLSSYVLALPSLKEQKKIAEILTTCDHVIELKEKLIAEKLMQKKWLMQNLLTGKIRLKGFSGEWKKVNSRELFKNVTNKNHKGELEVLSATQDKGIIPRCEVNIDIKYNKDSLIGYKKVERGNFVISLRSFQGGIEYSNYDGIISPAYTILTSFIPISAKFYKQYFKSTDYISRLSVALYGIRDGKQIGYNDFGDIKIDLPPLPEQTAIAEILSIADCELELLQQGLNQWKNKKKALMQLLLTGKVRV